LRASRRSPLGIAAGERVFGESRQEVIDRLAAVVTDAEVLIDRRAAARDAHVGAAGIASSRGAVAEILVGMGALLGDAGPAGTPRFFRRWPFG
jgi:hypothetical protein